MAASSNYHVDLELAKAQFIEAAGTTEDLSKPDFKLLILKLCKLAASGKPPPKDADLETAFTLADEDQGGTVDLGEFLNLYSAVIAGEVTGLSGDGLGADAKKVADSKRASFISGLQEKRARWREMTEEKVATGTKAFNEAAGNAAELQKPAFKALVTKLVKESGGKTPNDADLEAAFTLADEDQGGTVDLDEFLNLFAAVIAGEVSGLAGEGFEKKKEVFMSGLQEKRARWREMTEEKVATGTKAFNEAAGVAAELKKPAFKALITKLIKASGKKAPDDADLEEAFTLADEDQGGTVDLNEFLNLFAAVIAGEVSGLAGDGFKKKEKFVAGMKTRAGAAHQKVLDDEARRGKMHTKDLHSATGTELQKNMEQHGRLHTSNALSLARTEFENRESLQTVAQDIGHLGNATKASLSQHAVLTADNTSAAEHIQSMRVNMRKETGEFLKQQGVEYDKRDHNTVAQDIGNLGHQTIASLNHHAVLTADNTSAAEHIQSMRVNMRKQTGEFLKQAGKEYDARDHNTVTQDIGHLGHLTQAFINSHAERTADNTPEAEWAAYMRDKGRLLDSLELAKSKVAWEQRRDAGIKSEHKKFALIDVDGSGTLELEEILGARDLLGLSEVEARSLFAALDADGSGGVDLKEFMAHYKNHTTAKGGIASRDTASSSIQEKFKSAVDLKREADASQRETMAQALTDAKSEWQARRSKAKFSFTIAEAPAASALTMASANRDRSDQSVERGAKIEMLRQTVHGRKAMTEALEAGRREYAARMAKASAKTGLRDASGAPTDYCLRAASDGASAAWDLSTENARAVAEKAGAVLSGGRAALDKAKANATAREARERAREEVRKLKAAAEAGKLKGIAETPEPSTAVGPLWFVPTSFAFWRSDYDRDGKKIAAKATPANQARAEKKAFVTMETVEAAQRNLASMREARDERARGASIPREVETASVGAEAAAKEGWVEGRQGRGLNRGGSLPRSIDYAAAERSTANPPIESRKEVRGDVTSSDPSDGPTPQFHLAPKHATSYAIVEKRVHTAKPSLGVGRVEATADEAIADEMTALSLAAAAEEAESVAAAVAARAAEARARASEARSKAAAAAASASAAKAAASPSVGESAAAVSGTIAVVPAPLLDNPFARFMVPVAPKDDLATPATAAVDSKSADGDAEKAAKDSAKAAETQTEIQAKAAAKSAKVSAHGRLERASKVLAKADTAPAMKRSASAAATSETEATVKKEVKASPKVDITAKRAAEAAAKAEAKAAAKAAEEGAVAAQAAAAAVAAAKARMERASRNSAVGSIAKLSPAEAAARAAANKAAKEAARVAKDEKEAARATVKANKWAKAEVKRSETPPKAAPPAKLVASPANVVSAPLVKAVVKPPAAKPVDPLHRAAMLALYEAENPSKASEVDGLLVKYSGREEEIWKRFEFKYGAAAVAKARATASNSGDSSRDMEMQQYASLGTPL